MHIVIVQNGTLPAAKYGGTERVIWHLGKELTKMGHKVTFVAGKDSKCDFADIIPFEDVADISKALPKNVDIVHFHASLKGIENVNIPRLFTLHGNTPIPDEMGENVVFVSENHAKRYGSASFVHNGLDWEDYGQVELNKERKFFHFLGNGAWRVKNLRGAIRLVNEIPREKLYVFGGVRFNLNMGIRFTFTPKARFFGMVGNDHKKKYLPYSKGLVFPVLWHEPFGLALIESLYFGTPVFGTPYGSLPEIIIPEVGFLSNDHNILKEAMTCWQDYDPRVCHQYVKEKFNSKQMAEQYLKKYTQVLDGEKLNPSTPKLLQQPPKFLSWNR